MKTSVKLLQWVLLLALSISRLEAQASVLSVTLPTAIPSSQPSPLASPAALAPPTLRHLQFDHIENDTLFFSDPTSQAPSNPLKTGLFELNYLGSLKSDTENSTYLVLTGKPCQNCMDDRMVYVMGPDGAKPTGFVYPGKILEPKTRALLLDSRTFFGRCLPRRGDVLLIFQKEKIDRRSALQSSVLIAEVQNGKLDETFLERHLPSLSATLKFVKKKICHEIEGRNRLMLSQPLDLHPHSEINHDEDSEKDEDKDENRDEEKDTDQDTGVQESERTTKP